MTVRERIRMLAFLMLTAVGAGTMGGAVLYALGQSDGSF